MLEVIYGVAHSFAIGMSIVAFKVGVMVVTSPFNDALSAPGRWSVVSAAVLVCLAAASVAVALAAQPLPNALGGALGLVLTFAVTVVGFMPFRRWMHRIVGYRTPALA